MEWVRVKGAENKGRQHQGKGKGKMKGLVRIRLGLGSGSLGLVQDKTRKRPTFKTWSKTTQGPPHISRSKDKALDKEGPIQGPRLGNQPDL